MAATAVRKGSSIESSWLLSDSASSVCRARHDNPLSAHIRGHRHRHILDGLSSSSIWGPQVNVLDAAQRIVHWHVSRGCGLRMKSALTESKQTESRFLTQSQTVGPCIRRRRDARCNAQAQEISRVPARSPEEKCEKVSHQDAKRDTYDHLL